jgi:hypothetical protein
VLNSERCFELSPKGLKLPVLVTTLLCHEKLIVICERSKCFECLLGNTGIDEVLFYCFAWRAETDVNVLSETVELLLSQSASTSNAPDHLYLSLLLNLFLLGVMGHH